VTLAVNWDIKPYQPNQRPLSGLWSQSPSESWETPIPGTYYSLVVHRAVSAGVHFLSVMLPQAVLSWCHLVCLCTLLCIFS